MSPSPASESSSTAELLTLLRELGRTERLEGYERAALRRVAAELERLQPGNLATRSEYHAVVATGDGRRSGPAASSRGRARSAVSVFDRGNVVGMEHRTVVESEWRPTHV